MSHPEFEDGDHEAAPPGRATVRRIHQHPADPVRAFRVDGDGYVQADDQAAREVSETVAYVARLAVAVGETLGAGELRTVEVMGPASVYAETRQHTMGRPTIWGLFDPLGSAPESLHDRLRKGR